MTIQTPRSYLAIAAIVFGLIVLAAAFNPNNSASPVTNSSNNTSNTSNNSGIVVPAFLMLLIVARAVYGACVSHGQKTSPPRVIKGKSPECLGFSLM
jgi:p-aminobenzoyl-glutamate transporter AbgT